jgi:Guanylate kinase
MPVVDRNPLLDGLPAYPLLIVISGPSGVGKDSILNRMRELKVPFHFVVTATDRPMREGERNGYDYHFVTTERFREMISQGELIEWARVYGHYKGIPAFEVRDALASGRDVVLRLDVQGAATVRRLAPDSVLIFVAPGKYGRTPYTPRAAPHGEQCGDRPPPERGAREMERLKRSIIL